MVKDRDYSLTKKFNHENNLVFKSESEIIPLSLYKAIYLNINSYGAIGNRMDEDMLLFVLIRPIII